MVVDVYSLYMIELGSLLYEWMPFSRLPCLGSCHFERFAYSYWVAKSTNTYKVRRVTD